MSSSLTYPLAFNSNAYYCRATKGGAVAPAAGEKLYGYTSRTEVPHTGVPLVATPPVDKFKTTFRCMQILGVAPVPLPSHPTGRPWQASRAGTAGAVSNV